MSGFPLCGRLISLATAAFAVSACSTPTPSTEAAKAKAALDAAAKAPTKASPRLAEGVAHRRRDRARMGLATDASSRPALASLAHTLELGV